MNDEQVRIAILDDYQQVAFDFADWTAVRERASVQVFSEHIPDRAELVRVLQPFDVVVAMRERSPFSADVLQGLPNLRLLVSTGPVNSAVDLHAARELGITVSHTGGMVTPAPELTWALILTLARHVVAEHNQVHAGGWQTTVGTDLAGSTLGLLGLGSLGAAVAGVGKAFGMKVVAWSQNLTPERCAELGVELVTKEELFSTADFLSVHLVLGDRTRGLVDAASLRAMKPTAYLVNTSRGPIVDESALVTALAENWIAGAGLDVFDVEPLPLDHPFRSLPNVVVTPHIGYVTQGVYTIFFENIVEDILAFLDGSPVRVSEPR